MTSKTLLDAYPLVRTDNIELLRAAFDRIIAKPLLQPLGRDRALYAFQNHCQLNHVGASYGSYGIGMHFRFPQPRVYLQIFTMQGAAEVSVRGERVVADAARSAVVTAGAETLDIVSDANYERLGMLINADAASAKLSALLGQTVQDLPAMRLAQDFSHPLAQYLRKNFVFLVKQMDAGVQFPPLIAAEIEQMLIMMFLSANRHNYSDMLDASPRDAAAREVRLTEEFIEANWNRPLKLEDIAAVTGVSARSVFRSFRKARGCSPFDFLRQVRLRHARARLERPELTATVMGVARACGFLELAQFQASYAGAFGEAPERTLARGRAPILH